MDLSLSIRTGTWQELAHDTKIIRDLVFIQEQQIAPEDEWDDLDAVCTHFVVYEQDQAIATARLLPNNSIGRVAVLKTHRSLKIGQKLMQAVIQYAKQQQRSFLKLSSQIHAIGFYQALGFSVQGQEYLDCSIPHIDMHMSL